MTEDYDAQLKDLLRLHAEHRVQLYEIDRKIEVFLRRNGALSYHFSPKGKAIAALRQQLEQQVNAQLKTLAQLTAALRKRNAEQEVTP